MTGMFCDPGGVALANTLSCRKNARKIFKPEIEHKILECYILPQKEKLPNLSSIIYIYLSQIMILISSMETFEGFLTFLTYDHLS